MQAGTSVLGFNRLTYKACHHSQSTLIKISKFLTILIFFVLSFLPDSISCLTNDQFTVTNITGVGQDIFVTQFARNTRVKVGSQDLAWVITQTGIHKLFTYSAAEKKAEVSDDDAGSTYKYLADVGSDKGVYVKGEFIRRLSYSYSGSTFTISFDSAVISVTGISLGVFKIPDTNYVIRPTSTNCEKIDHTTLSILQTFTTQNPSVTWNDPSMANIFKMPVGDSILITTYNRRENYHLDKATLLVTDTWYRPTGEEDKLWHTTHLDNLGNGMYLWVASIWNMLIYKTEYMSTKLGTFSVPIGGYYHHPSMTDIHSLNFLMLIDQMEYIGINTTALIITKTVPITQVDSMGSIPPFNVKFSFSYINGPNNIIFGVAPTNYPYDFNVFNLTWIDRCETKDGSDTCTACKAGYYLNTSHQCFLPHELPSRYGAKLDTNTVEQCALTNCDDCKASHISCQSCLISYPLHKEASAPYTACYDDSGIPSGWGKNGASNILLQCQATKCDDCKTSYTNCQTCLTAFPLHKEAAIPFTACYDDTTIPSGWGKNGASNILLQCQATNCDDCKVSYTSCQTCLTVFPLHKEASTPYTACYDDATIPSNWGKNGVSSTLLPCSLFTCDNCRSDYTVCITCQAQYYYTAPFTNCFDNQNITNGYGINGANKKLELCTLSNCLTCKDNYLECTDCKSGFWYKETGLKLACYLTQDIPAGYGKSSTVGLLLPCTTINCSDCRESHTQCMACYADKYYKEDFGIKSTCYTYETIPTGYGVVNQYLIGLCRVTGCSNCTANYANCESCNVDRYYVENIYYKSNCYIEADIPELFGKQTGTNLLKRCATPNCKVCQLNYLSCDACLEAYFYKESTGPKSSCMVEENIPDGWGKQMNTQLLATCILPGCHNCSLNYSVCVPCSGPWYAQNPGQLVGCYKYTHIPSGMGVKEKNLVAPCTVSGCADCKANYSSCVSCQAGRYFVEDNDYKKNCYFESTIPDGYGIKSGSNLLLACTTPNCRVCQQNYTQCHTCKSGFFYKEPTGIRESCMTEAQIPFGWGKQDNTFLLATCALTGCMNCKERSSICTSCYPNMWYYGPVDMPTGCYHDSFISSEYGKKQGQYLLEPCRVKGCQNCWANFSNCLSCLIDRYHLENNEYKQRCYALSEIPEGHGRMSSLSLLTTCMVKDCKVCNNDAFVCQECKNDFWLLKDDLRKITSCHASSEIPINWGKVAASKQLATCKSKGCLNCFEDYTECKSCGPDVWFTGTILFPTGCYSENDIPPKYGKNGLEKKLESCSLDGCRYCREDFQVCQECEEVKYRMESKAPITRCYSVAEVPEGYGANIYTQQLLPCTANGCLKCSTNYEKCERCSSSHFYIELQESTVICYTETTIPSGYGINSGQKLLSKCQEQGCIDCKYDHTKCMSCLSTYWYYNQPEGTKSCFPPEAMPVGYGKEIGMKILECTAKHCGNCYADYRNCLACKEDAYVTKLSLPIQNCYLDYEAPIGLGVRLSQKLLVPCQIPNCRNCSLSYSTCDICADHQYYSEAIAKLKYCYEPSNLPIGYGKVEPTGKLLRRCEMRGCLDCFEDNKVCVRCNPIYYYLETKQGLICYIRTEIPINYGVNATEKKLETCNVEHCSKCSEQFIKCENCTLGFYLYNGRCVAEIPAPRDSARDVAGTKRGLLGLDFDPLKKSLMFTFDYRVTQGEIMQISSLLKLLGFVNMKTKEVVSFPPLMQSPPIRFLENGFEIVINLGDYEGPFQLVLEDLSNLGYLKENIRIQGLNYVKKDVSRIDQQPMQSVVYGFSLILTYTRLFANTIGRPLTQGLSIFLDKLCSNWNLLLIAGDNSTTSTNFYLQTLASMQSYNPWASLSSNECQNSLFLHDKNMSCLILINYGTELLFLYILLALSALLQLLPLIFRNNAKLKRLTPIFGLAFWMRRTNAFLLQFIIMGLIQLRYIDQTKVTAPFIGYCLPILLYYAAAFIITMRRTFQKYKFFKTLQKNISSKSLSGELNSKTIADFAFEGIIIRNYSGVFLPICYQVRCVVLALTSVYMISSPKLQLIAILIVEIAYLNLTVVAAPFLYHRESFMEKLSSVQVVVVSIVKLISIAIPERDTRQQNLSTIATLIVFFVFFTCISLTVLVIGSALKLYFLKNRRDFKLLPNMLDRPIEALTPSIYKMKVSSRQAENKVIKDLFGKLGHINVQPDK